MEFEDGFLDHYLANKIGAGPLGKELIKRSRQGHLCMILQPNEEIITSGAVIRDGNRCYLEKNWVLETSLIEQVKRLSALIPLPLSNPELFEEHLHSCSLQPEQQQAIRSVVSRTFSLIYGGPGTGKTHTAATLVHLFARNFPTIYIAIAAPTGKAASHLEKKLAQLPITAKVKTSTLHRLLSTRSRIDADLVIVDEGSMIDVTLWHRLLSNIGGKTRLVILGDPDQLPPIEAGTLFAEMLPFFGISLSRCMRTDISTLHQLANSIRSGEAPLNLLSPIDSTTATHLIEQVNPWIGQEKPDPQFIFDKYRSLGIVSALKKGPFGVDTLHHQFLNWMRSKVNHRWWALPILVTVNEPRLDLYNGTLGILIGKGEKALFNLHGTAYFPVAGELIPYEAPPPIEPAFCLSIHKAQGSEFDRVIALFPPGSERLGREALYTAVTRARKQVELFGDPATVQAMVQVRCQRDSGFSERFQNLIKR